jgi:hypothetical protein
VERSEKISKTVRAAVAKAARKTDGDLAASVLPAIRVSLAETLGGTADLYYGTADPVYYREIGTRRPLAKADGSPLAPEGKTVAKNVLVAAVRRRRDAGGRLGRWNVLAASAAAALGRPVSERETKALYAASGRDLDASYVGRGTRAGAVATREDAAAAIPTDA